MVHEAGMLPARGRHAIPAPDNGTFRERWSKYLYGFLLALGILCVGLILGRTLAATNSVDKQYNLSMADAFAARSEYTRDIPVDRYGRRIRDPGYIPVFQRTNDLEDTVEAHDKAISEVQLNLASLEELLPDMVTVVKHGDHVYEITDEFWQAFLSKLKSEGLSSEIGSGDAMWLEFLDKNRDKVIQSLSGHLKAKGLMNLYKDEFVDLIRTELASSRDPVRLESLALANLVTNAELSLRKVNFFSTGLGARVDPFATSTTFADKDPAAGYQKLFSAHHALPPITALKSWEEPGDCWCAAPDTAGKGLAQLAVQLGHPMIPRQVTVENLPREASLDSETAPRVMEFWAQTGDEVSAAGCGPGPDGWVCLGRFSYNLEAMNHIQTFNLDVIVAKPITKTILRVVENWGGDHTCLYRLRLHGDAGPRK
jgi:SUN domain-containing protein 1/2